MNSYNPIKKKIALLSFTNEAAFGKEDLAIHATEEFRKNINSLRDFSVDEGASNKFGDSKDIYAGGGSQFQKMTMKAKLMGVNLIIYGRITHAKVYEKKDEIGFVRKTNSFAQTLLEIRVFDVHANKEIFSRKIDGNINDTKNKFFMTEKKETIGYRRNLLRYSIKVAVRRFMPLINKLGAKLDWTGRVAKIIGTKIYINAGRVSGIQVGDILKVLTSGKEIYDPESGALLGLSKGEITGTIEVIDYFGTDGAIAILHSGGSVTEGDFIQLY